MLNTPECRESMSAAFARTPVVRAAPVHDGDTTEAQRLYTIRAATTEGQRSSANILVNRRYAWRGYRMTSGAPVPEDDGRLTLLAIEAGRTVGTMRVGFDGATGLLADELFPEALEGLRAQGRALCEFTKLALDPVTCSRPVLASLFHVAYMHAHCLGGADDVVIEVNPRHVRYYQRMLGFTVLGPQRLNGRVNAPAVLMRLALSHAREQITRVGGSGTAAMTTRSLYPFFFSPMEETGILARLTSAGEALPAEPVGRA